MRILAIFYPLLNEDFSRFYWVRNFSLNFDSNSLISNDPNGDDINLEYVKPAN